MGVPGLIGDIQPFAALREGPITNVYKGYQRSLDRFVLLKVLRATFSQDEELAARFEAEAQLVAKVQHPCVVAVYAYGRDGDQAYIATEFVEGQDLHELIAAVGALPVELGVHVTLQAARGLRAAHERDVLHRDLKPSNLLVAHDGQVKLTDFGMASVVGTSGEQGELRGTPAYLAPELITGQPPSVQSDLFALGATLYEMLTARRAFIGDTTDAVLDAVLHHDPLSVLGMHAEVPARLRAICARLLAKDPGKRYARAEDVVLDLEVYREVSGHRTSEAAMHAFLDDPQAYQSPAPPVVEAVHEGSNGHAQVLPEHTQDRAPAQPEVEEERTPWLLPLLVAAGMLLVGTALYVAWAGNLAGQPSTSSERAVPQLGVSLEDLFEQPSWPQLDSAMAVARTRTLGMEEQQRAHDIAPEEAAALVLTVTPWAEVYVDGDLVGVTPMTRPLLLPSGSHDLVLRNPRFPVYRDSIVVTADRTDTMSVSLWDQVGRLFIEVRPWAVVSINGEVRDTIPPQDSAFVVVPGRNRLELQHPQLGRWTTTFRATAGGMDTLQFNLQELLGQ